MWVFRLQDVQNGWRARVAAIDGVIDVQDTAFSSLGKQLQGSACLTLNIRLEKVRARLFSSFVEDLSFGRRFCKDRPSRTRLFTSPSDQVRKRRSRQAEWSLGLELWDGFCRSNIDITVMAFRVMDSRAEPSAYAR